MVFRAIPGPIATTAFMPSPNAHSIVLSSPPSGSPGPCSAAASQHPEPTKRVLVVAYHFPPAAEVGAIRPQKLVKYLPRYGWEPLVLTVEPRHNARQDPTRVEDVADARV